MAASSFALKLVLRREDDPRRYRLEQAAYANELERDGRSTDGAASFEAHVPIAPVLPRATCAAAIALDFGELKRKRFPARKTLLERQGQPVIRSGSLVQIFAERGVGKTWLARTFAIVMASGGSAMEFRAPKPVKILYLDGEMASEDIQERDRRLVECLKPSREPLLRTVAADWQDEYLRRLDTDEGQAAIEAHVEWADVLIIDNRSCLFDPSGERDPNAWEPAQRWLLSLRRQGKAVILVHHSNRMGGPRGISNAEDPLDVIIALTRPAKYETSEGARFTLSFEKNRGFAGPAVAPLTARLTPGGWVIEEPEESNKEIKRKLLSVVSSRRKVGTPVTSANDAIKEAKVGRNEALKVWKELIEDGLVREQNDGTYNASFAASASA